MHRAPRQTRAELLILSCVHGACPPPLTENSYAEGVRILKVMHGIRKSTPSRLYAQPNLPLF